ncbi:MAG: hypothetical protein WDM77_06020 [Steroidobacteraceae bacterium]
MRLSLRLMVLLAMSAHAVAATPSLTHGILMTFWSDDTARFVANPLPGSLNQAGAVRDNPALQRQLDAINVLAYAFLQVDGAGECVFPPAGGGSLQG